MEKTTLLETTRFFKEDARDIKEKNSLLTLGYMLWPT